MDTSFTPVKTLRRGVEYLLELCPKLRTQGLDFIADELGARAGELLIEIDRRAGEPELVKRRGSAREDREAWVKAVTEYRARRATVGIPGLSV